MARGRVDSPYDHGSPHYPGDQLTSTDPLCAGRCIDWEPCRNGIPDAVLSSRELTNRPSRNKAVAGLSSTYYHGPSHTIGRPCRRRCQDGADSPGD